MIFVTFKAESKHMVVLNEAQINDIIIHRVGNSHKEEGVYLSAETIPVNENLQKVIYKISYHHPNIRGGKSCCSLLYYKLAL